MGEPGCVNIGQIVAWAGVGKSTLVNHWLRRMAIDHYRSAELVFGWSFYRQGSSGDASFPRMNFLMRPSPGLEIQIHGSERHGRKAKNWRSFVARRRTLLVLDGLEPLQNPPGPQEGRVREPALQALLRELAAFNRGLCVITTRMRSLILQITSVPRPCVVTWNNYPAMPVRSCSGRWA